MNHLNVEEVMKVTQIFHCKLLRENCNEGMHNRSSTPSRYDVINIEDKNQSITTNAVNKHGRIKRVTDETMRQQKVVEMMKLSPRGLFQPINGFLKMTDIVRLIGMNKHWWLFHIDLLSQISMKEHILTSNWRSGQSKERVRERTKWTVACLITGLNVSW